MIKESYSSCDEELKIDCQNSFIISGGNSVIKGFIDRVKYEI
jgi:actin-related protein